MLQQFTWQAFLIAALIFSLCWYVVIILVYYRKEFLAFFSGRSKGNKVERLPHVWEEELEDEPELNLMGKSLAPEGMSIVPMDALRFADKGADRDTDRDVQLGVVPDVLEELKKIFHILKNEDGNKQDFISLFALISSKYPKLKGTAKQQAINDFILENLPFEISQEELDQLWD
jgi:hypothetical protein